MSHLQGKLNSSTPTISLIFAEPRLRRGHSPRESHLKFGPEDHYLKSPFTACWPPAAYLPLTSLQSPGVHGLMAAGVIRGR